MGYVLVPDAVERERIDMDAERWDAECRQKKYLAVKYEEAKNKFALLVAQLQVSIANAKRQDWRVTKAINSIDDSYKEFIKVFDSEFAINNTNANYNEVEPFIKFLSAAKEYVEPYFNGEEKIDVLSQSAKLAELTQMANILSQRFSPTRLEKLAGIIGMFLGSLLALVTLGYVTSLAENSHRLFSGYNANVVNQFTDRVTNHQDLLNIQTRTY